MSIYQRVLTTLSFLTFSFITLPTLAADFVLTSQDIKADQQMSQLFEFNGFGCSGQDLSPHLAWKNAPKGTKSFAITVYDPDAPTGSGWWHWQVVNIPNDVHELAQGVGEVKSDSMPQGSQQITNDYGSKAFGGACPPKGHGLHRYQFTVHALKVEKLELPANASGALTGYMINANAIASATLEALYQR
ncbi:YbhB/YbcL family Raf kinase inhibitor-like protein [Saccharobesus litoralis]|uniref:YbhB/YbcL family Raf kinase inhibitor-like protein n=1 Tax=Saccharobesus litoralis TaxID=2172099 RepID=A0A2S0VN88_9ALTE|nr:YbhB/YbcL family Raf kinase inhibitor-like protein [Saccharobesus litoralis]AWB65639.1 YbhB/YbcL family Raf kinase inhibitor-like protein [Saccharobesus litoralis]